MSHGDIGPKARSLELLSAAHLPVPDARFLGIEAYREHAARAGVPELLTALGDAPVPEPDVIRAALRATPLDPELREELESWHEELGAGRLAVRSSANAEDLPDASFAGQHGTYFVASADDLLARVVDCWASLFSERAVRYRERNNIAHADVAMAVIVQSLVNAQAAGVAFTANPVDGSPGVLVEACLGIGESLVSGKVAPDRFVFDRATLALRDSGAGDKHVRIVGDDLGSVREEPVPPDQVTRFSIAEETAREVARFALRAEQLLGTPADIEWAFDGEELWLLQARPITTVAAGARQREPIAVWSNVNTGEILPDVVTPMTWSITWGHAQEIFGGMFGAFGIDVDAQELLGRVGGRAYFNLALIRHAFAHLPGINVDTMLGGMQNNIELPDEAHLPPSAKGSMLRVARVMPAYIGRHTPAKARKFAARLHATTDAAIAGATPGLPLDDALALADAQVAQFDDFDDALAFMAVAMLGFTALSGVCRRWLGDTTGALANRLVAGRGDVASARSGHALWALADTARHTPGATAIIESGEAWASVRGRLEQAGARAFLDAWDAFMAEFGHHRRGELELANPGWSETPDYILGIVRDYLSRGADDDPMASYGERARQADTAAEECRAALRNPAKRAVFERALAWGRASAASRENIKSEAVRWLVSIRRALLLAGEGLVARGVLERADDVFFLEYGELRDAAAAAPGGTAAARYRELVRARKAEHERLAKLDPPPVVVGTWDEKSRWEPGAVGDVLRGISVSAGVARGRARVFAAVDSHAAVLPGEILVAPFTDPGWTPYFVPAAGIVMDMGGLLSHGSIIAREYGIPAVVNVGPATRVIATGDLIEVDGDRGEVRLLDQAV